MAKKEKKNEAIVEVADLRSKDEVALKQDLLTLKKEQFNLRFQQVSGELKNPARIRQVRRNIAKIKTVISEIKNKEAANA